METIQNKILKAGLRFEENCIAKNCSWHTIEKIIHPILSKTSKHADEKHYQNLLGVLAVLEDSQTEAEFAEKMVAAYPEDLKDLDIATLLEKKG